MNKQYINNSECVEIKTKVNNICFGTGIAYTYRYNDFSKYSVIKYWVRNALKNKKQFKIDKNFESTIISAYNSGIRMFDTSRAYGGAEYALGKALKKFNREDYYLITKLSNSDQYKCNVESALKKSLKELGTEYVDLYLMHWPVEGVWIDNWKQMEELYRSGLCKEIGVCNCNIHHLQKLIESATIKPMVNQIECHPLFTQNVLREYCEENNIRVMAYTATGRMDERLRKTCLVPIAKKYNKSIAQVILRWHQQIGNIPIVNSTNPLHVIENANICDFFLTDDEIDMISGININSRLRYDPDNCDFSQL